MTPLLSAASLRHLWRHPAQLLLALLGLALGVGTIVAVDVATSSARRALELSVEAVNGAATDQIVGGPTGIDEALYLRLRNEFVPPASTGVYFAPVLDGYATVGERTLELLGVDPFASAELAGEGGRQAVPAVRSFAGVEDLRRWLTVPGAVLMSETTRAELGLLTGRGFFLTVGGRREMATLIGELKDANAGLDGVLFSDIAQAQEWLGAAGKLSRIDVRLPRAAAGTALRMRLRSLLPPELELRTTQGSARETFALTDAFTTNLRAMSLLALLVGTFLIYGAISFAVVQRRPIIAVLRALGATRRQVLSTVLAEALVLGVLGAVLGVVLGLLIGRGLVQLVAQTINDLYFVVAVRAVSVPPATIVKGLAAGIGTAFVAALLPALEVAASAPQLALSRSALESRATAIARALALLGAVLGVLAALIVMNSSRSLFAGFVALFLLLVGVAALTPTALRLLALGSARLLGRRSPVLRVALGAIAASLSRTGVAIAALGMALTAMIGVAIMVQSFRESLREWLTQTMRADVYVSAPGPAQSPERQLDPEVIRAILAVPAVRDHSESRWVSVPSARGPLDLNAIKLVTHAAFSFTAGEATAAWKEFARGAIFISEPLAWRLELAPADTLTLVTASGPHEFRIAAVYREYGNDHGEILMNLPDYQRLWHDQGISGLGLYLTPGVGAARAIPEVRAAVAGRQALLIRSNADLRELSLRIFDRTFVIARVLNWLAAGVAALGLLSALIAWELEREREIAILRALGLTPGGTSVLVLAQTVFMGCAALLAAIPAGVLTALVLTDVINRRAFGWRIDLHLSSAQFTNALLLALAATIAAAAYPAWRGARAEIAHALREE